MKTAPPPAKSHDPFGVQSAAESPAENLAGAFALFLEASQAIESQHTMLASQVQELREDLSRTSASLQIVLNALPAAVIVVEGQQIGHFNTAASQLLPGIQTGTPWQLPLQWRPGKGPGEYQVQINGAARTVQVQVSQQDQRSVIQVQDITENLKSKEEQERVGRLASMGQMSASIAHQLRTPLATALLYSSHLCSASLPADKKTDFALQLKQQLLNLEKLSSSMLKFLQSKRGALDHLPLQQILNHALQQLEALCAEQQVVIQLTGQNHCSLLADQSALVSALVGVIENGLEVSPPGQAVNIHTAMNQDTGFCTICIEDNGPGISPDMLENLFEPFASNRINGTGLGLAIARNTIRNHGGQITAENKTPSGARFTISLPMNSPQP